jgi:O-antigen ligase
MSGYSYPTRADAAPDGVGAPALRVLWLPAVLGAILAYLLYLYPPPSIGFALAGGLGIVALLFLAIARYEIAVGIGFALLGVVVIEPAPVDVLFAMVMAVALVTGRFDITRAPLLITILIIAFLALNVLSTIEAVDPNRAAFFLATTAFLSLFALWLTGFVNSANRARIVLIGYLTAAVISALLATAAILAPFPGGEVFTYGGSRAKGLFQDPNVYGPFLIPAALIVLQEALEPRLLRIRRPLKVCLFLVLIVGVFVSFSRGAFANLAVALAVMLLVLVIRRGGARQVPAILLVLAVGAIGVFGALQVGAESAFLEERSAVQTYDTDRFAAQRLGIELASAYPVGVGPGQFEALSPVASHSTYVRVLSEQGILGLVVFGGLMLATLLLAARNALVGQSAFGIGSAALLGAWCGILVNSFVIDSAHWRHLWVIAALIWVASTRRSEAVWPGS